MKKKERIAILATSPLLFAEGELTRFLHLPIYTFSEGKPPKRLLLKDRLYNYRSAKDKKEPTLQELRLRAMMPYLYRYASILNEHIRSLEKEARHL
mgnify:CR=1 FL=1